MHAEQSGKLVLCNGDRFHEISTVFAQSSPCSVRNQFLGVKGVEFCQLYQSKAVTFCVTLEVQQSHGVGQGPGRWVMPAGRQYCEDKPLDVHASSSASMLHAEVELIRVPLLCLSLQSFQGFLFPMEVICPGFVVLLSFQQAKLSSLDPARCKR